MLTTVTLKATGEKHLLDLPEPMTSEIWFTKIYYPLLDRFHWDFKGYRGVTMDRRVEVIGLDPWVWEAGVVYEPSE